VTSGEDPSGWFEGLYASAEAGEREVPWQRGEPNPLLVSWSALPGAGRRALVVGSGFGDDAEHVAGLGYDTTAFDIAPTAVATAKRRFPESKVEYLVADLLDPPADWTEAFDFVLEVITVQALPPLFHTKACSRIAQFVAPGGMLLAISAAGEEDDTPDGPPWPLTRREVEAFTRGTGLETVRIEDMHDPSDAFPHRWRAEFRRPA
jgi:SAM-dependent methyltransferase